MPLVTAIDTNDYSDLWELLQELHYGRSGSVSVNREEEYAKWKKWCDEFIPEAAEM